ncbi:MAG: phosphoenolpyruvate-utilizing N-terminal domain-containing protein, partial [Gammaproteobacteria bacterium]
MSIALYGMGVSRGIAIGNVHVIQKDQHDIREYKLKDNEIDTEVKRLESAITCAREQLRAIRKHIPRATDTDIAAFIDTHLLMLEDSALTHEPARLIREFKYNAEWALKQQRDALVSVFEEMNDPYLRT